MRKAVGMARDVEAPRGKPLKTAEVCRRAGIGKETLRFYERSGILGKPARTASGYRMYDEDVLERLAFIKRAQKIGFSLGEIRHIIEEAGTGDPPCGELREILLRRLSELESHLREMEGYRRDLAAMLHEWEGSGRAPVNLRGSRMHLESSSGAKTPISERAVVVRVSPRIAKSLNGTRNCPKT